MLTLGDRQLDQALGLLRYPVHIGHIALVHAALSEEATEGTMQLWGESHQDQTGGVAIEAMHQLGCRPVPLHTTDQGISKLRPQARLTQQAMGFVEHQQIVAPVHDPGRIQPIRHHRQRCIGRCDLMTPH